MTRIGPILEALRDGETTLEEATAALQRARHDPDFDELELSGALDLLVADGNLTAAAAATLIGRKTPSTQAPTRLRPASPDPAVSVPRAVSKPHRSLPAESDDAGDWAEPQAPPVRLGVGDVLRDRFVIEEAIGEGGMGLVFRARDRRREEAMDRNPCVAIKFLGDQLKSHPDALIALQREARRMQQLSHPHIASVYDFDRDGAHVYLVMELLEGDSLDRVLERTPGVGLPTDQARRMIEQAGSALRHAHSRGVVHSDFKPANVFLTRTGEVKIIDFGIARIAKDSTQGNETTLTVFDAGRLGAYTNAYASPEQILATEDPHPKDDVYSFGLVVYEALTGRHPFGSKSAVEARFRDLKVEPVPGLSAQQNSLLTAALSFDRKQRLDGVAMLTQAFALNDEPIVPMRDVLRPRRTGNVESSGDSRRNWGIAALAAVAVAGAAFYYLNQRTPQADTAAAVATPAPEVPAAVPAQETPTGSTAQAPVVIAGDKPNTNRSGTVPAARAGSVTAPVTAGPDVGGKADTLPAGAPAIARSKGNNNSVVAAESGAAAAPEGATAAAAAPQDAGERSLYRWVDKDGTVQFGETPPAEYADVAVKVVDM